MTIGAFLLLAAAAPVAPTAESPASSAARQRAPRRADMLERTIPHLPLTSCPTCRANLMTALSAAPARRVAGDPSRSAGIQREGADGIACEYPMPGVLAHALCQLGDDLLAVGPKGHAVRVVGREHRRCRQCRVLPRHPCSDEVVQ